MFGNNSFELLLVKQKKFLDEDFVIGQSTRPFGELSSSCPIGAFSIDQPLETNVRIWVDFVSQMRAWDRVEVILEILFKPFSV
ncbi:hypothetical protein SAMN04515647_2790 [Cohaesibacter sp. ES.047]|uniref:hypothetical protein n=1 Tax=Cohaesibacter sp. ES.047 TaxID=1798205 RepID=UPI000BB995AF|nr:hypothetical protein [Cohaesibacter sp. ES.047]SNY92517.1 hypothetical protein SAMN04515647_2790 [Cohaesibacter sp. ES.047]